MQGEELDNVAKNFDENYEMYYKKYLIAVWFEGLANCQAFCRKDYGYITKE